MDYSTGFAFNYLWLELTYNIQIYDWNLIPQFMTTICDINVYFKYTVRHGQSCGKPFVE